MNLVGCCGFVMAQAEYYESFRVVEIQRTFYQPPRPGTAERWREEAPEGFEFTLKAWQLMTHESSSPTYRRLREDLSDAERRKAGFFRWNDLTRRAWDRTAEIADRLAADKVLFQCPASFEPTSRNKDRLTEFFSRLDRGGLTCIWEPRGDWTQREVGDLCDELELVHCTDPCELLPATAGLRYFRFHGPGGHYSHEYSDDELEEIAGYAMARTPVYFLFNNVSRKDDAWRLQQLIASTA